MDKSARGERGEERICSWVPYKRTMSEVADLIRIVKDAGGGSRGKWEREEISIKGENFSFGSPIELDYAKTVQNDLSEETDVEEEEVKEENLF